MDKKSVNKKVVSGLAWEGITKVFVQVFTWTTTIFVARLLSPDDYGVVAISGVFIGVLAIVTDMGFVSALINKEEITQEEKDSSFWFSILFSIILFICIYHSAPYIAAFYDNEILVNIIRVSALILPLSSLKILPTVIAMRNMDFKYRAVTEMVGQFATSISSVIFAMNEFGVWTLIYSVLIGQTVVVMAYMPLLGGVPKPVIKFKKLYGILTYGAHLMGAQILEFFTMRSDVLVIGYFLSPQQVGFYSMGFQLASVPLDKIGSMFNRVGFPSISRVKEDKEAARGIFVNMHKYLLLIALPILTGLAIIADDLVVLLLSAKWEPLVPIIQVLCVLNLLRISGMLMPYAIAGLGMAKTVFQYELLSAVMLPFAFLVGVQYGLEGVFAAWFIVYPVMYLYLFSHLSKLMELEFRVFFSSVKAPAICSFFMITALIAVKALLLKEDHFFNLIVTIVLGALMYAGTYYFLYKKELVSGIQYLKEMRKS